MMKFTVTLAAGLIAATAAFAADPVEGTWRTVPDDNGNFGDIKVAPCGAKLCGVLIKSYDPAGKTMESPNVGKKIIWDMVPQGGGAYGEGMVWSPDRDKTYASKMQLNGKSLAIKGCVLGGLICRDGGVWSRVSN